jgi:hypothetical protein
MLARLGRFRLIAAGQAEVLVLLVDSDALLVDGICGQADLRVRRG